ncbi:MAG: hypothetical protein KME13_19615 [Myxacorys californica WJT36-NPBG1]|jgi:hypothetical protein|nr:hypothetical protein [Myxacorys californica WJT36-NPBG1]
MNRLETIRAYFIERFFTLLTSDPEFSGLTEPAELFDASGAFNVPANHSGFVRVPTLEGLRKRIEAASPEQKNSLESFGRILARTLKQMFGSLAAIDRETGIQWARRLAPVIRHPDQQTYWPVDVGRYLNFDDGTLRSRYYDQTGENPLSGNLFSVMFENAAVWTAPNLPRKPFETHIPFAATIGIDGSISPFPTSPLTAGYLNLTAADARLIPGRLQPTIFAEIKSLGAAIRTNRHYAKTALGGGRFSALQHNRVHADPILQQLADIGGNDGNSVTARVARIAEPIMLMFQSFYPADDGARRKNDGTGTNREFHHLAVGLLLAGLDRQEEALLSQRRGLLFVSSSPTEAKAIPINHPLLRFLDDSGAENSEGTHPVIFANTLSTQGYGYQGEIDKDPLKETAKDALDYNPDELQWWLGLGAAVGLGAGAGFAIGGPWGALIGAGVGLLVYLLAWALKKLFGGKKDRQKEWTEQEPWPGSTTTQQSFEQSSSHDIGPSGTTSETGGTKPGRSYDLKMIPHFPDTNLYGLAFAGGDTCRIVEDLSIQETLAWLAFEGGIGYQFARPLPGRAESSGTSIQNYFELFVQKFLDLQKAEAEVVYFGT